jgi:hypothetical protein
VGSERWLLPYMSFPFYPIRFTPPLRGLQVPWSISYPFLSLDKAIRVKRNRFSWCVQVEDPPRRISKPFPVRGKYVYHSLGSVILLPFTKGTLQEQNCRYLQDFLWYALRKGFKWTWPTDIRASLDRCKLSSSRLYDLTKSGVCLSTFQVSHCPSLQNKITTLKMVAICSSVTPVATCPHYTGS